jgi:hypothetical protein
MEADEAGATARITEEHELLVHDLDFFWLATRADIR